MKDIIPATKQSPILGLTGLGGGVGSNIVAGGAADSTYVDDVFSTYLWKGTGVDQSFNNGIKLGNSNAGSGVGFDGTGDYLTLQSTSDVSFGTGDFTIEFWVKKPDSTQGGFFQISSTVGGFTSSSYANTIAAAWNGGAWQMYGGGVDATGNGSITANAWYHIAVVRSSNTLKMYVNGTSVMSRSDTNNYSHTYLGINGYYSTTYTNKGQLSNFRVVKGTAVYTGNFTPPTAELTSIANTKLLCCNTPVMTTATVTPGDITVYGDPHPSGGPFTAIDGEGGMVWMKARNAGGDFVLMDTERGIDKLIFTNGTWNQEAAAANDKANTFRSFDNNGFTIGTTGYVNTSGEEYSSWTWRKQKGFFDIVPYSGDGTTRDIAHNLGCIPGVIIIKRLDADGGWWTYHRDLDDTANPAWSKVLRFDTDAAQQDAYCLGSTTHQNASTFRVGNDNSMNTSGGSYIAYLFAGGESPAATATSIDLDGSEGIDVAASSALNLGTSNFCIEGWIYVDTAPGTGSPSFGRFFQLDGPTVNAAATNLQITINPNYTIYVQQGPDQLISGVKPLRYSWNHIALTRVGSTLTVYVNGIPDGATATISTNYNPNSGSPRVRLGYADNTSSNNGVFDGKISNVRVTIGEPVYTSAFRVPTEPLTTTSQGVTASNVKLLCCNGSTTTSSTVTPATITAAGSPTAITDSPFDEPDGFKFGEEEDQNIITCGAYTGNGSGSAGPEVYLGWEPQWLLLKNATSSSENWFLYDSMRGIKFDGTDNQLLPNRDGQENAANQVDLTPTGFDITTSDGSVNGNNQRIIYMAIRKPDGYTAKPAEAGTDVFAMDTGNSSSITPSLDSGFPVDGGLIKNPNGVSSWFLSSRLMDGKYLITDTNAAIASGTNVTYDSNTGFSKNQTSNEQGWMWKRHAGFDVVATHGGTSKIVPHSLGKIPEMYWVKDISATENWAVYHHGLNQGTNPERRYQNLNTNGGMSGEDQNAWNYVAPTSTHISFGAMTQTGGSGHGYLVFLFSSVNGISKVGHYSGYNGNQTITLGFQPRLFICKSSAGGGGNSWAVYDSTRGISGTNTSVAYLNEQSTESQGFFINDVSSTGITLRGGISDTNLVGVNYIYYAHA